MALASVLKHTATVYQRDEMDAWVDGQPDLAAGAGSSFPCAIFPGAVPVTMLYEPGPVLERGCAVFVAAGEQNTAAGLPADAALRYRVEGSPAAYGKPGAAPKVVEAELEAIPYNATLTGIYFIGDYDSEADTPRWEGAVAVYYDDGGRGVALATSGGAAGGRGAPSAARSPLSARDQDARRALVVDEPVAAALDFAVGTRLAFETGDVPLTGHLEQIDRQIPGASGGPVQVIQLLLSEVREAL